MARTKPAKRNVQADLVRRAAIESLEPRVLLSSYYVSTGGSDTNAGTSLTAPFRTIQRAATLAKPGDTVLIRGGTYRETVTPARSGAADAPITFKAYNGENVVVSGADQVNGWSNHKGSIFKAGQDWDMGLGENQVFVDGQMMIEARWPNTTLDISHPRKATMDKASANSRSGTLEDAALTQSAGTWNGATLHMIPGQSWFAQTGKVTSSSPGKLSFSYAAMSGDEIPTAGDEYYLTGKFVALDSAGEWFRDPGTGQLFLWTPDGGSPSQHTVEAKKRDYAFDLRLRTNITIEGIGLFAATITTSRSSGSIHLNGIDAKYVGHFTVMPGREQPWDESILLEGDNNVLENSRIMGASGSGVIISGDNSRVQNNIITDTNYNGGSAAAILVADGSGHRVVGNTIHDSGKDGIKISHVSGSKILNNVIYDVMLQAMDGGGIYTYGTNGAGTEIAYNKIWNVHSGGYGSAGIMLDNGSSNYVVHHNVVYDVDHGMKMNTVSRNNKVVNNTFLSDDRGIVGSKQRDFSGSIIKNNIFTVEPEIGSGASRQANLILDPSDARFLNLRGADLRLASGSPAINAGVSISPFTNGYLGAAPDVGAYESGKAAFSAGATISANSRPAPAPSGGGSSGSSGGSSSGGSTSGGSSSGGSTSGGSTSSGGNSNSGGSSGGGGTTTDSGGQTGGQTSGESTPPPAPPPSTPAVVPGLGVSQVEIIRAPRVMVGGEKAARGKVSLVLTNDSNQTIKAPAAIALYASADGSIDPATDMLLAQVTRNIKLKAGASKTYNFTIQFAAPPASGDYQVLASLSGAGVGSRNSRSAAQGVRLETPAAYLVVPPAAQTTLAGRLGRKISTAIEVQNTGNIATQEALGVSLTLTNDATGQVTDLGPAKSQKINLASGGSRRLKIKFALPRDAQQLPPGSYTLTITLQPQAGGQALIAMRTLVIDA